MTADEMRECMAAIGWSQRMFALVLNGGDRNGIREMMNGEVPIPHDIADWLQRLARYHQANPPPAFVWKNT